MGIVSCENCRAIVNSEVAICPSCGAEMFVRGNPQLLGGPIRRWWRSSVGAGLIAPAVVCAGCVALALFASWWLFLTWARANPDPVEGRARKACELALRIGSLEGDRIEVPQPITHTQDRRYTLEWPDGQGLTMPNGYGAMSAANAVCFYDGSIGTITSLRVNGKPFP